MKKRNIILLSALLLLIIVLSYFLIKPDNSTIYKNGREFTFRVSFSDTTQQTNAPQKVKLKVTGDFYPQRSQKGIEWIYYLEKDTSIAKTGVKDNGVDFYLHPPRQNSMYFTSFSSFPQITYSKNEGLPEVVSEGTLYEAKPYKGEIITNPKTYSHQHAYFEKIKVPLKELDSCIKVTGYAYAEKLDTIFSTYWFNSIYGFVKWEYKKSNGEIVTMELESVNFN